MIRIKFLLISVPFKLSTDNEFIYRLWQELGENKEGLEQPRTLGKGNGSLIHCCFLGPQAH